MKKPNSASPPPPAKFTRHQRMLTASDPAWQRSLATASLTARQAPGAASHEGVGSASFRDVVSQKDEYICLTGLQNPWKCKCRLPTEKREDMKHIKLFKVRNETKLFQ